MEEKGIIWPEGKRCAVLFTFDLDGESTWENGNRGYPNGENYIKSLSVGQYGPKRAVDMILDKLDEYGVKGTFFVPGITAERWPETVRKIRATFFTPGRVAELYPEKLALVKGKGHEIAALAYAHENMALLSPEEQEAVMKKSIAAIEAQCGVTPKGFRASEGELTLDTLRIAKSCGIDYSSNLSDDDRPYFKDLGEGERLLEIPVHWAMYDLPYFAFNYSPSFPAGQGRLGNYTGVLSNWKDEFSGYHEYGLCYVL